MFKPFPIVYHIKFSLHGNLLERSLKLCWWGPTPLTFPSHHRTISISWDSLFVKLSLHITLSSQYQQLTSKNHNYRPYYINFRCYHKSYSLLRQYFCRVYHGAQPFFFSKPSHILLAFLSSKIISISLASIFSKKSDHIYICVGIN